MHRTPVNTTSLRHAVSDGCLRRRPRDDGNRSFDTPASDIDSQTPWSETRRKGITSAEKICLGRIPRPSPEFADKFHRWCLGGMPSASPMSVASSSPSRPMKHVRSQGAMSREQSSPLQSQEERCQSILGSMFPVIRQARGKPTHTYQLQPTSASAGGALVHAGLRAVTARAASASAARLPATAPGLLSQSQPGSNGNHPFKRKMFVWDPEKTAYGSNVVRLIQGASATRVVRDIHGRIAYEKDLQPEARRASRSDAKGGGSPASNSGGAGGSATAVEQRRRKEEQEHFAGLRVFRKRLLARHGSLQAAFQALDVDASKDLTMREWAVILSEAKLCSNVEARAMYSMLDANHDGHLTPAEFHAGIESIAPASSVEVLRKRLVCLGFSSTLQALATMNGSAGEDITAQPLTFEQFAAATRRVWVIGQSEQQALFDEVRNHNDPSGRASLGDLVAGLIVTSPCLLLEELRERLLAIFGSLSEAFDALADHSLQPREEEDADDVSPSSQSPASAGRKVLRLDRFLQEGRHRIGFTEREASKIFRLLDTDNSGELDRDELIVALELSRPSLDLEDMRMLVRQCYRSIEVAFRQSFAHGEAEELNDELHFSTKEFLDVLEPIGRNKKEMVRLAVLMGAGCEGGLTLREFFRRMRLFAPSFALESIRLQLLQRHRSVQAAFASQENPRAVLDRSGLSRLLSSVGVTCPDADGIFDILDIRSCGFIVLSEMIAALQCLHAGGLREFVDPDELKARAENRIRQELAPVHRCASELKLRVRKGLYDGVAQPAEKRCSMFGAGKRLGRDDDKSPKKDDNDASNSPTRRRASLVAKVGTRPMTPDAKSSPRRNCEEGDDAEHGDQHMALARQTFQRINDSIGALPPEKECGRTMSSLRNYFGSAQRVVTEQKPYIDWTCSRRTALHTSCMESCQRTSVG
eukprot:TRINITY_DN9315_c1_g2_i2.p1 TRINITY_DN9315_c1_g2~~TRINITY_DN9315_c1_g2_i2.p1  ORF type:complete len:928 (+),score=167.46 TRINITY_DN9315_c1_g2_i2:104-2887(+)